MVRKASRNGGAGGRESVERDPFEAWRFRVEQELGGADFRSTLVTRTVEGLELQPLFASTHPDGPPEPGGLPGEWPFTRGARAVGSNLGGWLRCARADDADPATVRREILAALEGGATAIWLQLDRVARLGLRTEAPLDPSQVGRGGAAIYDLSELERTLRGVPLERATLILDAGANALPVAAVALALCERQGLDQGDARLFFSADPLAAWCRDGSLPGALEELEQEAARLALHCAAELPQARAIAVSTIPYHEAGADAVQELGWALATGVHYLRCLEKAGLEPGLGARQLAFRFAVGSDIFLEIAKLRAARRLWSLVLRSCGEDDAGPAWIHAVSSGRTVSRRDPWVNMLRVTTQLFAAVVGGADAVSGAAFDEALGRPEASSRRLALNTQAILAEESHLGRVVDPVGGSYYVEWLTDRLTEAAWSELRAVELQGGMAECLEAGEIRRRVDETWQERRRRLADRTDAVTGVSRFPDPEDSLRERSQVCGSTGIATLVEQLEGRQPEDRAAVEIDTPETAPEALRVAAAGGAGLGELSRALGRSSGVEGEPWPRRRDAAPFEALRAAADRRAAESERPGVFVARLGAVSEHREAVALAAEVLQVGGLRVVESSSTGGPPEGNLKELLEEFDGSGQDLACLAAGGDIEAAGLEEAAQRLREAGAVRIYLATAEGDGRHERSKLAVDGLIHEGADIHGLLVELLRSVGAEPGGAE